MLVLLVLLACKENVSKQIVSVQQNKVVTNQQIELSSKEDVQQGSSKKVFLEGLDSLYVVNQSHTPFSVRGYFDQDSIIDSAYIVRDTIALKDDLFVKLSAEKRNYLLLSDNVLDNKIEDFNWVGIFRIVKKGEKIGDNVSENGDILSDEEIPKDKLIRLKSDAIFVHADESCGGGAVYFQNGKFHWIQQE